MKCEPFEVFTRQEILLINFAHRFPPIVVKKKKKKKNLKNQEKLTYSNFSSKKPSPFFGHKILKKKSRIPRKLGLQNPNKYTKAQPKIPNLKDPNFRRLTAVCIKKKNRFYAASCNRASGHDSHQQISPTRHLHHLHSSASAAIFGLVSVSHSLYLCYVVCNFNCIVFRLRRRLRVKQFFHYFGLNTHCNTIKNICTLSLERQDTTTDDTSLHNTITLNGFLLSNNLIETKN